MLEIGKGTIVSLVRRDGGVLQLGRKKRIDKEKLNEIVEAILSGNCTMTGNFKHGAKKLKFKCLEGKEALSNYLTQLAFGWEGLR